MSDLPFLLVTAQRPDGDLAWPPPVERPLVLQVPLGPLHIEEATALVCGIFDNAGAEPTDRTVATLVDRGGGNPLFLVELASLSATCGNELPGSLRALIAARIDQLPAAQRAIVDNAAVLGTADSIGALVRFAEAMGQEFRQRDLDELAADGLLDVDGRWWRFRSAVVREVAYQTLTKRVRAQRHAGVAAVLAERGASIDDVAHHAATAAELLAELGTVDGVNPTITEHAIQALLEAATAALDTGRLTGAIRTASRALDLHPRDPKVGARPAARARRGRARAAQLRRGRCRCRARCSTVRSAAGDRIDEGEARRRLGGVAQMQGDLATARREHGAAVDLFREDGDERRLADALRARGFAEVFGGSLDDARWLLDEAMDIYHRIDDERGHAWTHQNLAWVAFQAGDFADAEVQLAEAKERFEALGDANGVIWADGLMAYVLYFQRRLDEAEALAVTVERDAHRWADTWASLMMTTLLANLRLWTGRLAEAEQLAERALAGFRETNDRYGVMQALGPLNRARAALGKKADAKRGVEESVSLGKQFGELGMALQGGGRRGDAPRRGRAGADAGRAGHRAQRDHRHDTGEAFVLLALALCQVGDFDEALAVIEQVVGRRLPVRPRRPGARPGRRRRAARGARRRRGRRGDARRELLRPRPGPAGRRAGGAVASATTRPAGAGSNSSARWRRRSATSCSWPWPSCSTTARRATTPRPSPLAPGWRRIVDSVVVG